MTLPISLSWAWVALSVVAVLLVKSRLRARARRLPPGPTPLPILGNVLQMPRKDLGKEFAKLSNRYGASVVSERLYRLRRAGRQARLCTSAHSDSRSSSWVRTERLVTSWTSGQPTTPTGRSPSWCSCESMSSSLRRTSPTNDRAY